MRPIDINLEANELRIAITEAALSVIDGVGAMYYTSLDGSVRKVCVLLSPDGCTMTIIVKDKTVDE